MSGKKQYPTHFQKATCWGALTGVSLLVIVTLVCGLVYGLGAAFIALEPVLLPVIVAGILAYLLFPCVVWVQKKLKKRVLAVLAVMFTALLLVVGLAATVLPPLVQQTSELVSRREQILAESAATGREFLEQNSAARWVVDTLYDRASRDAADDTDLNTQDRDQLTHAESYPDKVFALMNYYSGSVINAAMNWLTAGMRAIYGAAGFLIGMVLIPVFLFYFLLHSENIALNWHTILPLRRSEFRREVVETLQQINGYIISFVRGQMLVSLIDGVLLGIALMIMGVPYAITIGAAAAMLGIIPYIGMVSTSIPALLIAWFTWHDMTHVLGVAGIFIAVSQLDGWILQPKILGKQVGMHDLTIMFSVLFWGSVLGGIVGALLAVPLTASIKVIFTRYVWSSLSREERPHKV